MQALDTAFTAVSEFDATKFINSFVEVVTKTFDFTNTKLNAQKGSSGRRGA